MKRVVYTRPDGGVNVCCPAPEIMAHFSRGGFFPDTTRGTLSRHMEQEIEAGRPEWLAKQYVNALAFGGCTTAEAFGIIRDRDCAPFGTGFEVWSLEDLPPDRWFRNAWRRSQNGGPLYIDMRKARRIHLGKIKHAAKKASAELQWGRWNQRIRDAETPEELRSVWPRGLALG